MKNHRPLILTTASAAALAGVLLFAAAPASAQTTECQPDDIFCAEVRIGGAGAGLRIGGGRANQPPPPPPPEPQPPVVIVQPQQPPPPPPPRQVVVYRPPPPQPRVIQVTRPAPRPVQAPRDRFPYTSYGVHLHVDGVVGDDVGMGGGGVAFRFRPIPHIALDVGGSVFGGQDYNGLDRVEIPLTVTGRFFFNPRQRFQFYGLVQLGGSWSHASGVNVHTGNGVDRDYGHLGGGLGMGAEWRMSRVFAMNFDIQGFLRGRVDDDPSPEFTERDDDGSWVSTDLSGGVVAQLGMTFYWGR